MATSPPSDGIPVPGALRLPDADPVDGGEAALVAAAQDGNVRAFEALLSAHESKVLRVLRYLGVPASDREDVAQEVFVRVFRHLGGFRRGRPFGAWVYRIAVNATHDWRLRGGGALDEVPWTEEAARIPGSGPDPDLARRLLAGLAALSERERAVFVLRELEGLETAAVARTLGITSITVRRHLGLARDRLRRLLDEK
ncbi:MAG TPA: RNA polymerase sigma factor [Candidatus Polarisedimenticolaceae bacterium]|nr:RNA polymerase sigma factor [Candidatus Polarisedimenticolaceae bacterium]